MIVVISIYRIENEAGCRVLTGAGNLGKPGR